MKTLAHKWDEYSQRSIEEFKSELVDELTLRLKLESFKWWAQRGKVPRRFRLPRDRYMPSEANLQTMEQGILKEIIRHMERRPLDCTFLMENRINTRKVD